MHNYPFQLVQTPCRFLSMFKWFLFGLSFIFLILILDSCGSGLPIRQAVQNTTASVEVKYSVVCIIHGDGDYLYHDTSGNEYTADLETLDEIKRVAQQNPFAEVIIFHQKPKQNILFFFPQKDGEFYYYRNGQLIADESYLRDGQNVNYDRELELYKRYHVDNRNSTKRFFLYFGHEIPEYDGAGYDASYPAREFTIKDLAIKLKGFTNDASRFDLLILSTCYGGTPYTIEALSPYTGTIIASPENLHLSYFDIHPLEHLEVGLKDNNINLFANRFAGQAFDKLTSELQTAISVAEYKILNTHSYLSSVNNIYEKILLKLKNEPTLTSPERCDCSELPEYNLAGMNEGVRVFYRPAIFGRSKNKQNHSGWECWKGVNMQRTSLQVTNPEQR